MAHKLPTDNPNVEYVYGKGKGIPKFSQDATKAQTGYHAEKGDLQGAAEKRMSKVIKTYPRMMNGAGKAGLVYQARHMGPPKATNWRTSAIPILKRKGKPT